MISRNYCGTVGVLEARSLPRGSTSVPEAAGENHLRAPEKQRKGETDA